MLYVILALLNNVTPVILFGQCDQVVGREIDDRLKPLIGHNYKTTVTNGLHYEFNFCGDKSENVQVWNILLPVVLGIYWYNKYLENRCGGHEKCDIGR